MKVAVVSIGDEVLFGEIVDTNVVHIARQLSSLGYRIVEHRTVGDNDSDIGEAISDLSARYDAIIATGGLGPTLDDVTVRAVAKATARRLIRYDEALRHLRSFEQGESMTVIEGNEKQAFFPTKSTLIPNPVGTAYGFAVVHDNCHLFFLPGVPQEMEPMLEHGVIPILKERMPRRKLFATRALKVFGISEVQVDRLLKDLHIPQNGISLAMCAQFPEIEVKLRGEGANRDLLQERLSKAAEAVKERLQECVFAEGTSSMPEVVARLFREKKQTLAIAESCTGGEIAKLITDLPGSSSFFLEGAITYSNDAKIRSLGIPSALIRDHGAVSSEVATAMAEGIRNAAGSDVALSVTGIAGPEGGSPEKPVGTVFIALATSSETIAKVYRFAGDRERIRTMTSFVALDWLRRYLLSLH